MKITTVILAGGEGSRIGGDKGLRLLHGRPLIAWVLEAVQPQSAEILISANKEGYTCWGYDILADELSGAGPLAGLQAALHCAKHDRVASVPCDTPYLPQDLLPRLSAALGDADAAVAVAAGKRQPTIALYHKHLSPRLDAWLENGERKVGAWLDSLRVNEAVFDDAAAFANINTLEELELHNHESQSSNHNHE